MFSFTIIRNQKVCYMYRTKFKGTRDDKRLTSKNNILYLQVYKHVGTYYYKHLTTDDTYYNE